MPLIRHAAKRLLHSTSPLYALQQQVAHMGTSPFDHLDVNTERGKDARPLQACYGWLPHSYETLACMHACRQAGQRSYVQEATQRHGSR